MGCAPVDAGEVVAALLLVAKPTVVFEPVPVDPVGVVLWFVLAVLRFEEAAPWLAVAVAPA